MAAHPGTSVHTADNAVPPLNDDLAGLLDGIRGVHPGLDLIADGLHHIAVDQLTTQQTHNILTFLAGSTDPAGQQIDVLAGLAAVITRLTDPIQNPSLRHLPTDTQDTVADTGREWQVCDAHFTPRDLVSETAATIAGI